MLASLGVLGLDIPFTLPFLTDRSQGTATGERRMADELNSAPCALRSLWLSAELQMLQHLARERPQHCSVGTAGSGQKVYENYILFIALFLLFSRWMGPESSSPPVWLTGF